MQSSAANRDRISHSVVDSRIGADAAASGDFGLAEHLGKLLTGSLDIPGFRQWFAKALCAIEAEADEDTIDFASLIENRIAEYARGHVPDRVLLDTLRADVTGHTEKHYPWR